MYVLEFSQVQCFFSNTHTVQLTCWCLCWRCLIHELWIIQVGCGADACLKLLCVKLKDLSKFSEGYRLFGFACSLLCESRWEIHHIQLWFRAQFDLNSQQRAWEKWYESSVIAKLSWASMLHLSKPACHGSSVVLNVASRLFKSWQNWKTFYNQMYLWHRSTPCGKSEVLFTCWHN